MNNYDKLEKILRCWEESRILFTAVELNLFDYLSDFKGSKELSEELNLSQRHLDRLLNGLVVLGFLKKEEGKFKNEEISEKYLNRKSKDYNLGIMHINSMYHYWSHLTDVIRYGKPATSFKDVKEVKNWTKYFIEAMQHFSSKKSKKVADLIDTKGYKTVLDLGGGSGEYLRAILEKNSELMGTLFDKREVIEIAKGFLKGDIKKRIKFIEGDFIEDEIKGKYDVVLLSNIIHAFSLNECKNLFKKVKKVLNENGLFVIHDHFLNEERTDNPYSVIFAINMLVHTENGDVYTFREIEKTLSETGLKIVKSLDTGFNSTLLLINKV